MNNDKNCKKNDYKSKRSKSSKKISDIGAARKKAKNKENEYKTVYYSFLTIILLICLVQLTFSAILNISKTIAYNSKVVQIRKIKNDAENKNTKLKRDIKEFSKLDSLEAIARNNLKMAGAGEILIIINEDTDEPQDKNKKKKGLAKNDNN